MDARIKRLLDASGYSYGVDAGNDAKMVFRLPDGRSQLVIVEGSADEMGAYSDFTISSAVGQHLSPEQVTRAMKAVGNQKAGGFLFISDDFLVFKVDIATDATAEAFKEALEACLLTADQAEKAATGEKDAF